MTAFVLSKIVSTDVGEAAERFTAALTDEGLGVQYALDLSEIIASKTVHPLTGQVVGLGVCTPELARQVPELDPTVAALLPCGAFVSETPEGTAVGFLEPHAALGLTGNVMLQSLGADARCQGPARTYAGSYTLKKPEQRVGARTCVGKTGPSPALPDGGGRTPRQ